MLKIKNIAKLGIIFIIQVSMKVLYMVLYIHVIHKLKYSVPKEIFIIFHNGSNYDSNFIINELVKELEGQFTYLKENTGKQITFSVPIEKEVIKIDKKGNEITKAMYYRLQFIDNARFMAISLSNLVNNL